MRIIAGKYKNRKIETTLPKGKKQVFRPTQSKTRAAVFNKLNFSQIAFEDGLESKKIIDLYCGCGTFGLEALSRGAAHVTFVDQIHDNLSLVKQSASNFDIMQQCSFLCLDASSMPLNRSTTPYDIIFMDPPYYNSELIIKTLDSLLHGGWLAKEHLIIIETASKQIIAPPTAFKILDEAVYGNCKVIYLEKEC